MRYTMSDGSGLSRYNYVTAGTLTTVLEHMYKDPRHRDAFVATLPIAGKDGTIATRLRDDTRGGQRGREDRIDRQRAGAVRIRAAPATAKSLAFSILANDFVIPSATINWIADLAVEILSNFTRH